MFNFFGNYEKNYECTTSWVNAQFLGTLESVIHVGQGISVGPGRFGKKNKRRAGKI